MQHDQLAYGSTSQASDSEGVGHEVATLHNAGPPPRSVTCLCGQGPAEPPEAVSNNPEGPLNSVTNINPGAITTTRPSVDPQDQVLGHHALAENADWPAYRLLAGVAVAGHTGDSHTRWHPCSAACWPPLTGLGLRAR
jgi:hypothetical protein